MSPIRFDRQNGEIEWIHTTTTIGCFNNDNSWSGANCITALQRGETGQVGKSITATCQSSMSISHRRKSAITNSASWRSGVTIAAVWSGFFKASQRECNQISFFSSIPCRYDLQTSKRGSVNRWAGIAESLPAFTDCSRAKTSRIKSRLAATQAVRIG